MSAHAFDDLVDGLTYCSRCGIWQGATDEWSMCRTRRLVLSADQRIALAYVRDMVRRNPIEACQDAVSKHHTEMVRTAVATIDDLLAGEGNDDTKEP